MNELDQIPADVIAAAKLVANYFALRGVEKWELLDICSRNHAAPVAEAYGSHLLAAIERTCVKRIEEIEGRGPTIEEIREHGNRTFTSQTGLTLYTWKGQPICEFEAGKLTEEGWKHAHVREIRPAIIQRAR